MMNKHIEDFLDYFCTTSDPLEYAVMITGKWGCGKTHFIKHYQGKNKELKFLHISLYGITKFSEIDDLLFSELIDKKTNSKRWGSLVGFFRKVECPKIKEYFKFKGAEKMIFKHFLKNNYILVFDDLERCSIPLVETLGYINSFVEFQNQKVILISNEEEIENADENYKRIKEKLVGKTLSVQPNLEDALDAFIEGVDENNFESKSFLKKNRAIITKVYSYSGNKNIRIIRQSLFDFEYLWRTLDKSIRKNEEVVQRLLEIFLFFSIELKKGTIKPEDIGELFSIQMRNAGTNDVNYRRETKKPKDDKEGRDFELLDVFDKCEILSSLDTCIDINEWSKFFKENMLGTKEVNESLLKNYTPEGQSNWDKLWHRWDLKDEDFKKTIAKVEKEFENREYTELGVILHVALMLLDYSKNGLYKKTVKEILKEAKAYIDSLEMEKLTGMRNERDIEHYGLGFYGDSSDGRTKEQQELWDFLIKKAIDSEKKYGEELIKNRFDKMLEDPEALCALLRFKEHHNYAEKPILNFIKVEDFFDKFKQFSSGSTVNSFRSAFEIRYERVSVRKELLEELEWLKEFKSLLSKEKKARKGENSGHFYKLLEESIIKIIGDLGKLKGVKK